MLDDVKSYSSVDKVFILLLLLVTIACWTAMIWATTETYKQAPPLPEKIISTSGKVLIPGNSIKKGQSAFQKADLMDYGSIYGMGSYFGEDYTAKYLKALSNQVRLNISKQDFDKSWDNLTEAEQFIVNRKMIKQLRGINLGVPVVEVSQPVAKALESTQYKLAKSIRQHDFRKGYTKAYSLTEQEARYAADFILYSALTTVANRPGEQISWTNNWPYEPSVGNKPTTATFVWTWISITLLLFGIGVVVVIFKIFIERESTPSEKEGSAILLQFTPLTPSQRSIWKYVILVALLLLVQIASGSILAHYYYDRESFYGLNIVNWLPFAFLRAIHIQTPIVWIGMSWIGSALFLAPLIGKQEPTGQRWLVNFLFWVTVLIVGGVVLGNYLGILGVIDKAWFWFGNQGLSYLEIGRFWQMLFFVGLLLWSLILLRTFWPTLKSLVVSKSIFSLFHLEHLLWYSSLGVAVIYAFGMIPLTHAGSSFTITDFWRWWVVHMWVEWAFELFTAAIMAYFLMAVGLVSRKMAERAVIFEWILILLSGILGTGHHLWWVGEPGLWIPVGSIFSFLEILPLFLLIIEAINQYTALSNKKEFPYKLAFLYILGAAFWNFVGAGVFGGGTINAPLVNYYEHGTFLTLNHAHTAMFGAFGLLAIGLIYLILRYMAGNHIQWSNRLGIWAFWLYNLGMILWITLNFFPIGWPQLEAVYEHGYAYARSLDFYNTTLTWQWMRFPGDVIFAIGALIMAWDFSRYALRIRKATAC